MTPTRKSDQLHMTCLCICACGGAWIGGRIAGRVSSSRSTGTLWPFSPFASYSSPRMPLKLYVLPGSPKHDLPSLDPESIGKKDGYQSRLPPSTDHRNTPGGPACSSTVAASYLQLLRPGQWQFVHCTDPGQSPSGNEQLRKPARNGAEILARLLTCPCTTLSGSLPFLQLESGQCVAGSAILHNLQRTTSKKLDASAQSESVAFQALLDTTVLPLTLHSLYSVRNQTHSKRNAAYARRSVLTSLFPSGRPPFL